MADIMNKGYCVHNCEEHSCSKENLLKVLRIQKRAAKIILDAEKTAPSVGLFNTFKWVPFYAESYVNRFVLIYKRLNGNTRNI